MYQTDYPIVEGELTDPSLRYHRFSNSTDNLEGLEQASGCTSAHFLLDSDQLPDRNFILAVTIPNVRSGTVSLPSAEIQIRAFIYGRLVVSDVDMPVTGGSITIDSRKDNFDAHFTLSLAKPDGTIVEVKNGRFAKLNGHITAACTSDT